MNVTRGLFRAWVAISALWVMCVAVIAYDVVPQQVSPITEAREDGYSDVEILNYLSSKRDIKFDIAGAQQAGYTPTEILNQLAVSVRTVPASQQRWVRVLLPWIGLVLIPPLVLLATGRVLIWIGRGFAR
jgi:hypothetical protein